MTYTEKELTEIVQLINCGETLEEAKNIISLKYKLTDQGKRIKELAEQVKEYFKVDTLVSRSRSSEHIAPMAVFTYLIHELLGDYKAKNVHETFSIITKKTRCTFYHYTKMYEDEQHLVDRRKCKNNYIANHFLILKGKILNEDVSEELLIVKEKIKKDCQGRENFEKNKEAIIHDIYNNFMSYKELNRKYFFFNDHRNVKKFFALEEKKYTKFIRSSYRTRLSIILETYKKSFKNKIEKGYTFEEINKHFSIYPTATTLRKVASKYEKIIFDILLENERIRKKETQTKQKCAKQKCYKSGF